VNLTSSCVHSLSDPQLLLLFTICNIQAHNTRILESKHHPFMSQYKQVVDSVYWCERVHRVTILSHEGWHAVDPSPTIAVCNTTRRGMCYRCSCGRHNGGVTCRQHKIRKHKILNINSINLWRTIICLWGYFMLFYIKDKNLITIYSLKLQTDLRQI
jgi:hypothetical protein